MRRRGMGEAEILAALVVTNQQRCRPPLPPDEVERIAKSIGGMPTAEDTVATDGQPEPAGPFALPIREFIGREREHREPILADEDGRAVVGHFSLTLCGALGGQGKTTWFIDLALHLAAGIDYPPFKVPAPVSILIIENEGPEDLFAEKLANRLKHFDHELEARLDVCVVDWGAFTLADNHRRAQLIDEIEWKGYDLVFGDPLDSMGIKGVGSPENTREFLDLMKDTGLNSTVAWWLNTHPRKEETKEALNEISGAWGGKPDTVFLLRMLDDDRTQYANRSSAGRSAAKVQPCCSSSTWTPRRSATSPSWTRAGRRTTRRWPPSY
jgi:AAA domain/Primase C terminal 1 (PriCT-1)